MQIKFNINDTVLVRLTPAGEKRWNEYWQRNGRYTSVPLTIRDGSTKADGRVRFHLHEIMHIFGDMHYMGAIEMPFVDNAIEYVR